MPRKTVLTAQSVLIYCSPFGQYFQKQFPSSSLLCGPVPVHLAPSLILFCTSHGSITTHATPTPPPHHPHGATRDGNTRTGRRNCAGPPHRYARKDARSALH